ncbi:MAG: uridine monophosphate kinase [Deltaproteobacteria bacterium]|nr:uridine monophosphate kinase [Deltaproteobacteria bacterium]
MAAGYRRALVKISGEALAADAGRGIDRDKTAWLASEIALAARAERQVGIVIGGGNILRGANAASLGVPRLVADEMGMVATVLNAMTLKAALQDSGIAAAAMCAFPVGRFIEVFDRQKTLDYLDRGYVTIFAGGTGNPCFTTDSAAALRAVEIGAQVMIKGTQVSGVYDKDPRTYPDARRFERISASEVLGGRLGVIDAACVDIMSRHGIPVIVLNIHEAGNLGAALAGEDVGTVIG